MPDTQPSFLRRCLRIVFNLCTSLLRLLLAPFAFLVLCCIALIQRRKPLRGKPNLLWSVSAHQYYLPFRGDATSRIQQ